MANGVTLVDVAKVAGVSKSTVSDVLRKRQGKVKVSDRTQKKIFEAVKSLNYFPTASARALSTGRSMNIGFIVSNKITFGLSNFYFSSMMKGVEEACRRRDYNCIIGEHDLATSKNFVAPQKIKTKKVDAIIICGHIEPEVVQVFVDHGTPFILVGESTDFPRESIFSISEDMACTWKISLDHLYAMGHRKIGIGGVSGRRGKLILDQALEDFNHSHSEKISISQYESRVNADQFEQASESGLKWCSDSNRPTAVIGHAYWCVGFLSTIFNQGYICPKDVSLVSTTDSPICKWYNPPISAVSTQLKKNGDSIANLMIDYVEDKIDAATVKKNTKILWEQGQLINRKSSDIKRY